MSSTEKDTSVPASFPTLKPAFKVELPAIISQYPCGDVYTGGTLIAVPFTKGVLESVEGFEPKLKFEINTGVDFFRIDSDKTHGRLNVRAVATDEEGRSVIVNGQGTTKLNEHVMAILLGSPDAKSAPWGACVEHWSFEAGHDYYKPLEGMHFASSQRFIISPEGVPGVQVHASQIISGTGDE